MTPGRYPVLDPRSPQTAAEAMRPGACALAMMIKAPRPGASKTRLSPPLTPVEAAGISECFLRDTTANIAQVVREADASGGPVAAGVAVYTPVGLEHAFDGLLPEGFVMIAQHEGTFGERLFHAVEDLLALGYGAVCVIDSDSPTLPAEALRAAVVALAQPGDRAVLGPSEDGGYYLLGLKKPHRRMFEDIDWSTERVAPQTRQRAAETGLELVELPTWYDVDDAPTLRSLCQELFGKTAENAAMIAVSTPEAADPQPSSFPSLPFAAPTLTNPRLGGYAAPRTREFLARILAQEGRARIWASGADEAPSAA